MPHLATLHSRLNQLRRRRAFARWGTAWSALLVGVLWTITLVFLIDWLFLMSRPQRFVALLLFAGVSVWVFRRYTLPWLGWNETETDVALEVERKHHIDSDLVAALQFDTPAARAWGSPQLEQAVVNYVDEFSPSLNVFEGFSWRPMARRAALAALTLLVLAAGVLLFPAHASAFFNRLLLGSAHYPTKTIIERITINGQQVFPAAAGGRDPRDPLVSPYGRPLAFEIECRGELPEGGNVRLRGVQNRVQTGLALEQVANGDGRAVYAAQLPRLVDSVWYQAFLGDAYTDPQQIQVIPLPAVTVELTPRPPKYAANGDGTDAPVGALQVAVIEGSDVDLAVHCANKRLQRATLTIGDQEHPLASRDEAGREWVLPRSDSPLVQIHEPVRFALQVEDADGLSLEKPVQGYVRIKADRSPRVAVAMVSRRVLPTARPRIVYGATDDYGLSKLVVRIQIARMDGRMEDLVREIAAVPEGRQPLTVLRGEHALDLGELDLAKRDELRLVVEAFDYRGDLEPKSTLSEPLILEVTDREGILAGLLESDEKSARQLDAIIQRELGIGETP